MMPGEQFSIQITDIAGNENILVCTIPEVGDPAVTSAKVSTVGQMYFNAGKDSSSVYWATPVSMSSLASGEMELPMLFGMSYKVGTYKITKTANGFTVTSQLNPEIFTDPANYKEANQRLYVYTEKPGIDQLSSHSGQLYQFGQEIPVAGNGTVWIVPEEDMEMLISDISWLEIYNFSYMDEQQRQADPAKYQEYLKYVAYQRNQSADNSSAAGDAASAEGSSNAEQADAAVEAVPA